MRICVVLPGEEFLATAGVRIRYQRIAARLAAQGHSLDLTLIDDLQASHKPHADAYIISKCYDARGLIVASDLRALGLKVGVDIFDDYYSQAEDSRFVHLRRWLREIAASLSFALCSTPFMLATIERLLPGIPCHMMNDPFDVLDLGKLETLLKAKLERARATRTIDVSWFGIGDNGYFPVGLSDLAAFGHCLAGLTGDNTNVRLSILTNRKAMTPESLQALGRLPIPWRIEEWSEEAEARLLSETMACFLPVNAQPFSIVKSLNRAVTALCSGAQVLSAGFPLYESFAKLIYRDAAGLRADIMKGEPKLNASAFDTLAKLMERHASPEREAQLLVKFLGSLPSPAVSQSRSRQAILHGRLSTAAVHKFAQRNGHLSVAGPKPSDLNHDVRVSTHPETGAEIILLSTHAVKALRPALQPLAKGTVTLAGKTVNFLPCDAEGLRDIKLRPSPFMDYDPAFLANYAEDMGHMRALLAALFGDMPVIVSESASPFMEGPAARPRSAT